MCFASYSLEFCYFHIYFSHYRHLHLNNWYNITYKYYLMIYIAFVIANKQVFTWYCFLFLISL